MIVKGDKKVIRGWVAYDWANSVYNLVISSAIFPLFYDGVTRSHYAKQIGVAPEEAKNIEQVFVKFFGFELSSSVLFSLVL